MHRAAGVPLLSGLITYSSTSQDPVAEAWRTVNAMFENEKKEFLKLLTEKDQALTEKDQALSEKNKLIEELMRKLGEK